MKAHILMVIKRPFWLNRLEEGWKKRSLIWLAGVRRVGKTSLCRSLEGVEYFDCELPRIRHQMEDPESFLRATKGKKLILDEIHRLDNPSELLKIAADHHPETKIIATGSSTLGASKKFQDTLTGRKINIHLTPLLFQELKDFAPQDITRRLLHGGLPPFLIEEQLPESDYEEWLASYWAKDVQELFHLEKRHSFLKFTELLLAQSGNMFEATRFASPCEVSRTTISNYLSVLEATFVAYVVRPFSTHAATEIISAPKVYGFDTGFICHCRGWINLRREDYGILWEHLVLNELIGETQNLTINYWRDKSDHEVDFVISHRKNAPSAIECKWKATQFDPTNLKIFRKRYPEGKNFVVATDLDTVYTRDYDEISVTFTPLDKLVALL